MQTTVQIDLGTELEDAVHAALGDLLDRFEGLCRVVAHLLRTYAREPGAPLQLPVEVEVDGDSVEVRFTHGPIVETLLYRLA